MLPATNGYDKGYTPCESIPNPLRLEFTFSQRASRLQKKAMDYSDDAPQLRSPSAVPLVIIVFRRTAKMTAVDQPNISTPFIAVIGPSKFQRCNGVTSP